MLRVSAAALRQHILDGDTYASIAQRYGSTKGAVTQRAHRLGVTARKVLGYHRAGRPQGHRLCVACTNEFSSSGPGNVVCRPCKSKFSDDDWTTETAA